MNDPTVEIYLGKLQGKISQDVYGENYYSFQGIPYAKPPVGNLRFKPPQSPDPWTGIRDATREGNECYQRDMLTKQIVGSEDCLFLNVYTKHLPDALKKFLKPVMVWIHGGGFICGSGSEKSYGPQFLITKDIVLVTINYRLGMLGFLSLEDPALGVTGNVGLKDQVMALKCVQKFINVFGGDSNNVTVFGGGAGAASVHLLMLTPLAKGLFSKVIAQSGCALNPWSIGTRCSHELMDELNLKSSNEKVLLEALGNASVDDILRIQENIIQTSNRQVFGPIVERYCENVEAFLLKKPLDALLSGNFNKVPLLLGYNSREGMICNLFNDGEENSSICAINFENVIPHFLKLEPGCEQSLKLAAKIKEFYFDDQEPSVETLDDIFKLRSDVNYIRGIYSTVANHLRKSSVPVYLYRFSLDASFNLFKKLTNVTLEGACHGDELGYLFKNDTTTELFPDSVEERTINRMVKFWTSFAKYGDPNPLKKDALINVKWKFAKRDEINFLDINEELKMSINPDLDRMKFWSELFQINPAIFGM